ncbi:hypothetical protein [Streptomyces sp. NPDC002855]|uniref:hypothetical protein n=1 Tax=Streptomyces sp. NPDC002855 TaxID=3154437 RepID=UPI00331A8777
MASRVATAVSRSASAPGPDLVMAVSSMVAVAWRSGRNRTAGCDADTAAGTTVTPSPHSTMAICEATDRARWAGTG